MRVIVASLATRRRNSIWGAGGPQGIVVGAGGVTDPLNTLVASEEHSVYCSVTCFSLSPFILPGLTPFPLMFLLPQYTVVDKTMADSLASNDDLGELILVIHQLVNCSHLGSPPPHCLQPRVPHCSRGEGFTLLSARLDQCFHPPTV